MAREEQARGKESKGRVGGGAGDRPDRPGGGRGKGGGGSSPAGELSFPGWFVPVLYGVVTLLLFRKFVFSSDMLFGSDTLSLGYMARAFFAECLRNGIFPLWNPILLGGTPFLDSLAGGDSLYPTSLLLLILEPYRALGWKLVLHVFAAGLFMYGWVRSLGRSRGAALLAGLAYLLAPHLVTLVFPGHDGKLFVSALTPLLFWATERALSGGRLRGFAGMAFVVALVILTTHFQQAYFLFGAAGLYALVRIVVLARQGTPGTVAAGRFALFLAFSVAGAGVSAVQLLPAVTYVTEFSRRTATTTRASEEGSLAYSSSWSLHPEEVMSLVIPEFVGNNAGGADWARDTYWGRNPFKLNHEYAGLVVLLLALVGLGGREDRGLKWTFGGIGSGAILYALGSHTPVWRVFYEVVPGISLFRAPSIAAFLFGFAAATLMSFGIDGLWKVPRSARGEGTGGEGGARTPVGRSPGEARGPVLVLGAASGFLLLGAILTSAGVLPDFWSRAMGGVMTTDRLAALAAARPFIERGFWIAFLLAGLLTALCWGALRGWVPRWAWTLGVAALLAVDLARVSDPFIQVLDFRRWAAPDPNIRFLQDRQGSGEPFRVLAMGGSSGVGQDVKPGMYGLELAAGHHPNDLARYRELIGMVGSGIPANFFDAATGGLNFSLLAVLNVRYVLWPVYRFGPLRNAGEPVMATTLGGGEPLEAVYEIPTLPRARLVGKAVILKEEETVPYLLSPSFDPQAEVVLNEAPPGELGGGEPQGEVSWKERGPNRLVLEVRSDRPALLVVADNWYPAWKAKVGGEPAPVLRANHTLRAVPVPAGAYEVEVYYDVGSLMGPLAISLVFLALLTLVVALDRRPRLERPLGEGGW